MSVAGALLAQAIVLGVVAIVMSGVAYDAGYGATRTAATALAWLTFVVGLASGLASIWLSLA